MLTERFMFITRFCCTLLWLAPLMLFDLWDIFSRWACYVGQDEWRWIHRLSHSAVHWRVFQCTVRRRNRLEWANAHIRWCHFGEVFSSRINPGFHCTGQMADSVYGVVWVSGLLMSTCGSSGPWWRWDYGMGRRMLWTTNTGAFYWWHFECTEIPWWDPEAIVVPFIHDHHLMLQHDNARPHVARICAQFLEADTSQFLHGQHTHRTCHRLSMFGMLWIGVYDSVFQFLPISSNFAPAIEEESTNIPQATINNLINSMQMRCFALREANGGHTRYWLVSDPPPNTVKLQHFWVGLLLWPA